MISDAELAKLPAKARKDPTAVELYQSRPYMEAYALHTDRRVELSGYRGAVGAVEDWEVYGNLSLAQLMLRGMKPADTLLDIGCGTGRLARKAIPYLAPGHYRGVDISAGAIAAARAMLDEEGISGGTLSTVWPESPFRFLWAFSVTIHLPPEELGRLLARAAAHMTADSRFQFSYVPEQVDARTGLKQFRHTLATYEKAAKRAGLALEDVHWIGAQRMFEARRR